MVSFLLFLTTFSINEYSLAKTAGQNFYPAHIPEGMVKNFLPSFSSSDAISSDELAANNTSRDDYSHDVNAPFEDVYISPSDELADSYDTSSDELFETFNPTAGKMTK